jgi:hypothetical protein
VDDPGAGRVERRPLPGRDHELEAAEVLAEDAALDDGHLVAVRGGRDLRLGEELVSVAEDEHHDQRDEHDRAGREVDRLATLEALETAGRGLALRVAAQLARRGRARDVARHVHDDARLARGRGGDARGPGHPRTHGEREHEDEGPDEPLHE